MIPTPEGVENNCTHCGRIWKVLYCAKGEKSEMDVSCKAASGLDILPNAPISIEEDNKNPAGKLGRL